MSEIMQKSIPIVATRVKILRQHYKVSPDTWKNWIDLIPGLGVIPSQRVYTPAQVDRIINHLGVPDNE